MQNILIKNARVYTIANGIQENTDVFISGGKIHNIGQNLQISAGEQETQIIDGTGKVLMPGFIDAHCHIGLHEESIGFEGDDINERTDPVTPHLRAIDAINPRDEAFELAIKSGVTTAATGPGSANVIGGTFTVIKLYGDRVDDMIVVEELAMKCAFGENPKRVYNQRNQTPVTRMGTAALLREALAKAREYQKKIDLAEGDASKLPAFDFKLESLKRVLNREMPLKAHAHRTDDIFTSIRIAKEFGVDLTLEHCTEGHLIAEHLAKEGYPAVVGPSFGSKSKFELSEKSFETAGKLHNAGVKVALMTDAPVIPLQYLPLCAALATKAGMDENAALRAITLTPAEILGVENRLGSIEIGKDADVVLWDIHPFDLKSNVLYTIVDGKVVYKA